MAQISRFPVVDCSDLVSENPNQCSHTIQQLLDACIEWGCFILVKHGIPEALIDEMLALVKEFFDLPEEEKKQYEGDLLKSLNQNVFYMQSRSTELWWDSLRLHLHTDQSGFSHVPEFLREVVSQYSQFNRKLTRTLVEAVSKGLELEEQNVNDVLELHSSFQVFGANLYPLCSKEDQVTGLSDHTDNSLFTTVVDGGVPGLQIEKHGQWLDFLGCPDHKSVWVNVADMLQIFCNGRFKSVKHRVFANSKKERISISVGNYPAVETTVEPATTLLQRDGEVRCEATTYKQSLKAKYQQKQNKN